MAQTSRSTVVICNIVRIINLPYPENPGAESFRFLGLTFNASESWFMYQIILSSRIIVSVLSKKLGGAKFHTG